MKTPKYPSSKWSEIKTEEINESVRLLVDHLDMSGGSVGDMDLYVLIRNYIRKPEVRKSINQVLNEHKCI